MKPELLIRVAAALLLLLCGSAAGAAPAFAPAPASERVVYRHATLIDGSGAAPRRDMAVVTRGPLIEAVVADGTLTQAQLQGARTNRACPREVSWQAAAPGGLLTSESKSLC